MGIGNYNGYHTKLTDEVYEKILEMAPKGLSLRVISKACGLHHETLIEWLKRAKRETDEGQRTIFTQLSVELDKKISNEIILLIKDVRNREKNWQACWELLKSLNREDFGGDALQFQYLVEIIDKLKEDIAMLKVNQGKGAKHEKEMDSGSDQK